MRGAYQILLIGSILFCSICYGQKGKPPVFPFVSLGYVHQGTNNIFGSAGVMHMFKRHTYVSIFGGASSYKFNEKRIYAPNFSLEYFYETKNGLGMGPMFTANYTKYKFGGIKTNCISVDAGWTIFFVTIFGGYNFSLDKKLPEQITPYRVGIKYP